MVRAFCGKDCRRDRGGDEGANEKEEEDEGEAAGLEDEEVEPDALEEFV